MECQYCKCKFKNVGLHQKRSKQCLNIQNKTYTLQILYERFNQSIRDINKELIVKYGNELRKRIGSDKFDLIFE